jgi:hypothetical protein
LHCTRSAFFQTRVRAKNLRKSSRWQLGLVTGRMATRPVLRKERFPRNVIVSNAEKLRDYILST